MKKEIERELTIDLLSDTHCQEDKIVTEGGDFLIHSGDVSYGGRPEEILPFLDWFAAQKYRYKILVPGNHDWGFEYNWSLYADECKKRKIILLHDSGVELEGIKIWGSAVQPRFKNWAFNRDRGANIRRHWDLIPNDTELLITHGPPMGILDRTDNTEENVGCEDLLYKLLETEVKLHVFGHIHEGRGYKYIKERTYVNASAVSAGYRIVSGEPIRVIRGIDGNYLVERE